MTITKKMLLNRNNLKVSAMDADGVIASSLHVVTLPFPLQSHIIQPANNKACKITYF